MCKVKTKAKKLLVRFLYWLIGPQIETMTISTNKISGSMNGIPNDGEWYHINWNVSAWVKNGKEDIISNVLVTNGKKESHAYPLLPSV